MTIDTSTMKLLRNITFLRAVIFILALCLATAGLVTKIKRNKYHKTILQLNTQIEYLNTQIEQLDSLFQETNKQLKISQKFLLDYERLQPMKIIKLASIDYQNIFDKKWLINANITTEDDFYKVANQRFNQNKKHLEKKWRIKNNELLQTLFYMNLVANMWAYGNKTDIKEVGCVYQNENTKHQPIAPELMQNLQTYVKTDIGCCADSTYLLQLLLTKAKIKNRVVLITGHKFNEAFIENKWMAFDATVNFWWHHSWEEIQNANNNTPFFITPFSYNNLLDQHPYYRESVEHLRIYLLLRAAYRLDKNSEILHPAAAYD